MNKDVENKDVKREQSGDNASKEEKPGQDREAGISGSGLLTNTPGSPRVPSPEEMAASPGADGMDNRINLDQQSDKAAPKPKSNKP